MTTLKHRSPWLAALGLAASLTLWASPVRAGEIAFAAARIFDLGDGPAATGDIDGDGDSDIVGAKETGSNGTSLLLLLNDGKGNFISTPSISLTAQVSSVALADVDGDRDLDLIAAVSNANTIQVFKNNGNGTFAAPQSFASGGNSSFLVLADLNGDNNLDIAAVNPSSNTVSVLSGSGTGSFAGAINFAVGTGPSSLVAGDFDGDGDRDLATANTGSNNVSVLKNDGKANFTTAQTLIVPGSPTTLTTGDLDGDGDLDLAAGIGNNVPYEIKRSVSVLTNSGSGNFAVSGNIAIYGPASAVVAGDIDKDGDLDLIVGSSAFSATVYGSSPSSLNVLKNDGIASFTNTQTILNNGSTSTVLIKDLDGDSDLDVVTVGFGSDQVIKNSGDGSFIAALTFGATNNACAIASGDLDSDGDLDLAVVDCGSQGKFGGFDPGFVAVLLNKGDGTFGEPLLLSPGADPRSVVIGDFDGDGDNDLATATYGSVYDFSQSGLYLLLNNGDATFTTQNIAPDNVLTSIATADLDGDGDLDFAAINNTSKKVQIFKNNGNGTVGPSSSFSVGYRPNTIALGDIDGDGDIDIVTDNSKYDSFSIATNNGNGSFAASINRATGDGPVSVTLADIDNDGRLDLVSANANSEDVTVRLNLGDLSFATAQNFATGVGARFVRTGDFDADGNVDIVTVNGSDSVSVLANSGDSTFKPAQNLAVGSSPPVAAVPADLNGDGKLDLATANFISPPFTTNSDTLSILLNTTLRQTAPTITAISPRQGPVGTRVTITGTGFSGTTAVVFRGRLRPIVKARFTVISDSEIQAIVPKGAATGRIAVITPAGTAVARFVVTP
ncbi:FG-GAP-like repeat-containing protein [Gloeobacter kilaueensis]|uniref:IPT/TIG domain-containing protein n=1 Tax=Gloeobacter kilaueensis (strain ATCC BAA-2537 / CCAP 1431/1 / ULC 316 / JS1) TaxID=1183438 RepID=U5QJP7_GLOK1|nr:FG-GAP-like repeat-containing protein [Gloeobacter kilaueensis]AGY57814.1 hypothetical protein GKIL_1568 [Gloeobacter kilaueensis JS1]